MSTLPHPRFYVYALARPDDRVFYVGKGQGPRVYDHERYAHRGHKCHKCNIIRKIWKQGKEVRRYILFTTDDEREALDYEHEMVMLYGRENLCNRTDGGDSPPPITPEGRRKISERHRGNKYSVGRKHSEETRRRMSLAHKGQQHKLGQKHSEETKLKMKAAIRAVRETRESRAKTSAAAKAMWADPAKRAAVLVKRKAASEGRVYGRYVLRAPDGTTHTTNNLRAFCHEYDLDYKTIHRILRAKGRNPTRKSYRGWTYCESPSLP